MDGAESALKHTVWCRLRAWRSASILVVAALAAAYLTMDAFTDATDVQDDGLHQIASLITQRQLALDEVLERGQFPSDRPDLAVVISVLAKLDAAPDGSRPAGLSFPANITDGLQTVDVEGTSWRLLVVTLTPQRRIAIAQQTAVRDEMAWDSAFRPLMVLLAVVPLLLLAPGSLAIDVPQEKRPHGRAEPATRTHRGDESDHRATRASKRPTPRALRYRLAASLSLLVIGVTALGAGYSFFEAFKDAQDLQDDVLRQIAAPISTRQQAIDQAQSLARVSQSDPESRIAIDFVGAPNGMPTGAGANVLDAPDALADGLHSLSTRGTSWRLLVKTLSTSERIAVGQRTVVRDEMAWDGALRTLAPLLFIVPMLLLVLGNLVRQMFRPVTRLANQLDALDGTELREMPTEGLPSEIVPFVAAINRLLARVGRLLTQQRRFVADAAHELRSPLTALSLQAERLAASEMSDTAVQRLAALRDGISRARVLLDQLLTLARVQEHPTAGRSPRSAQQIFRAVVEDLMPLADARNIDVGVTTADGVEIALPELDFSTLVKNLLDNAIRYTPPGGRVDLAVRRHGEDVVLSVEDTGPGIPQDERARVFDPFYRVLGSEESGSGLGLSIVKAITDRLGASVELAASNPQRSTGLKVTVRFPASVTGGDERESSAGLI